MTKHADTLSRRLFLQSLGATGAVFGLSATPRALLPESLLPESLFRAAASAGKKVTLLEDGGFAEGAWGWQCTSGASAVRSGGRGGLGMIDVRTDSGDYARFLVLGPVVGKTYTLTGWVRTEEVVAAESGAGAYFAASQFEFQGRPTEFTVDGKQATEIRYGNFVGTAGWRRFSQSVKCLGTTAWFEIVTGIYRASGRAFFSGLTFVEGEEPVEFEDTVSLREATALAHRATLRTVRRARPRAAILHEPAMPGAVTDPKRLGAMLRGKHDVDLLSAAEIADGRQLCRTKYDLLVLAYGPSFPLVARGAVLDFLVDGGDLLSTGGYAFLSPLVLEGAAWVKADETGKHGPNLLPEFAAWKASDAKVCTLTGDGAVARVAIAPGRRGASGWWTFDVPAQGEGRQFRFSALLRTHGIAPSPDGLATIGAEQLDAHGDPAYAARVMFEELRRDTEWHAVERTFYLVPDCVTLRVRVGLKHATGAVEAREMQLHESAAAVRINTALGWPEDSLVVTERQLGLFDADYRLKRVASLRAMPLAGKPVETAMRAEGYAASGVVGMNNARWVPLLEGLDASGRRRGAAGAMMHHHNGAYTRSSWAFFGVENRDIFAPDCHAGLEAFRVAAHALSSKCFLHSLDTNFSAYRAGEPVQVRVLVSNFGLQRAALQIRLRVLDESTIDFHTVREATLTPGETLPLTQTWSPAHFAAEHYRVEVDLLLDGKTIDTVSSGFNIWKAETLARGMHFEFKENYFQVEGRSHFLQGTDDYLHTFIDQDENAATWLADAQGCRDSGIDVYENLMGLRGPQHRPTETWWRWVDAMLLNTQRVGGIFFPGMLIFSNTAVSNADLADQKAYAKAFATRYGKAAGIMYYLNGDLELHDPNVPDLQVLYNDFLRRKYKTDDALRAAWSISPPDAPLGKLQIRGGTTQWGDLRTLDDFHFRTELVQRWLNAMRDAIREIDTTHPVTAEFYQSPTSGIDLLTALGKLELANFGYFAEKNEDYYRFPQTCRFLDQSMRGKGINVGEFGVKTHPAWKDAGYYIEARTEAYEQSYFLSLTHYGFALGASKVQNWCWKYPADLPFEWGINYPNELIPRDVRAHYRNSGLLFHALHPKYEAPETVVLLASDSRMGGQGHRVVEGQLNAIRLLLDANLRFGTLTDEFLGDLPPGTRTIFYPLSYTPSDEIMERLGRFVDEGGQLYVSGDISLDALRHRTRTERLHDLCGVEFLSERYPNIEYGASSVATKPSGGEWPRYDAAPSMTMRVRGAKVLLAGADGHPIVTEFQRGRGRVIFSADPIELHGDPRYQTYGHAFYKALLEEFGLSSEAVDPQDGCIHCLRVPSQDERRIFVLVNHSEARVEVGMPSGIRLALGSHLPGVVVTGPKGGVQMVETSGDVFEDGRPLLATDLHVMAIGFGHQPLTMAARLLILPMAVGSVTLHTQRPFAQPMLLMGEIVDGRWKQYRSEAIPFADGGLRISVTGEDALAMLLVCERKDQDACIAELEVWATTPWKLEASL